MSISGVNLYIVETPLQLLNALEAKEAFQLPNNHLIVRIGGTGFDGNNLLKLIDRAEWSAVHELRFRNTRFSFESRLLGARISAKCRGYCYDFQQFLNRRTVNRLARSFGNVKTLFLGNYLPGAQSYMLHFSNVLQSENLVLLDDGTDVLLITKRREHPPESAGPKQFRRRFRKNLLEWDESDAASVTFFTAYSIPLFNGDRRIENTFKRLKRQLSASAPLNEVWFLGQSLVEDGYVTREFYMGYLSKIKEYFSGRPFVYIPHPRQSAELIRDIKDSMAVEIRQLDVPVEHEIGVHGHVPVVLASFFCSALQNCRTMLGRHVDIVAFHIPESFLMCSQDLVRNAYSYFSENADEKFRVLTL